MNFEFRVLRIAAVCLGLTVFAGSVAAEDRPYTEGPVLRVTSVRTEPGMRDAYLKYLATTWKQSMEAQKAAGIVLDYMVYSAQTGPTSGPDVYLVTVFKNYAALDGLDAKMDPIQEKIFGDPDKQNAATIERGKMRTILDIEDMRQLVLK